MREIKFRVFDRVNKRMYLPDEVAIQFFDRHWRYGVLKNDCTGHYEKLLDDSNAIPMQFTGLYDKHGKEIYEGDIVSWCGRIRFVYLHQGECGPCEGESVFCYLLANDIKNPLNRAIWNLWDGNDVEILGNIYENPELLEGY